MTLSNQAIGAIMMALQNAILNQQDVTELLKGFEIGVTDSNELVVRNPPSVKSDAEEEE